MTDVSKLLQKWRHEAKQYSTTWRNLILRMAAELESAFAAQAPAGEVERLRVREADVDAMRDVYMSKAQREAYDRILAAALEVGDK